ncbi:hypothetical protein CMI37_12330 [Candidatus Pacearchaeota archaeon]|nr:hypothetical protein [Candidatus Pacearchaeota archaeon]|tara:strand:+ start:1347 stop:1976 length:630 start_codon:yes stop_codon:yes gene_type:complete
MKNKIPDQEKVWDRIAQKWKVYRQRASPTVQSFLGENVKLGDKVLDLGCGSGRNFMKVGGKIYGVDFSGEMLEYARKRGERLGLDFELKKSESWDLDFDDNFFDVGICMALLHCIPDKRKRKKTLREFYRVLKKGGVGLVAVWGRGSPRLRNKSKECFIGWTVREGEGKEKRYTYVYDKEELEAELRQVGFKILKSWEERNVNVIVEKV